jgi:hypothetical protein
LFLHRNADAPPQIFCCFVVLIYVALHFYNLAAKKWLLFKSLSAFCYLALTVTPHPPPRTVFITGRRRIC